MQLRVQKADGGIEIYLHTKVIGSIAGALSNSGGYEDGHPEHLAEAVTKFLRRRYPNGTVSSDEIHNMVEVVLCETGRVEAAVALHEHRINRQTKRRRVDVVHLHPRGGPDAKSHGPQPENIPGQICPEGPWDKSQIVRDLELAQKLSHGIARAVAGAVEEKVLRLDSRRVTTALIRELVANELLEMRQAELALVGPSPTEKRSRAGIRVKTEVDSDINKDYAMAGAQSS